MKGVTKSLDYGLHDMFLGLGFRSSGFRGLGFRVLGGSGSGFREGHMKKVEH